MEYSRYFEQSVNQGNLVCVIPLEHTQGFASDLQEIIGTAMNYGYSFKNHIQVRDNFYLVFELDMSFIKQLGSFMETFDQETENE